MYCLSLDGSWQFKEFVGLDWVWRDSVMPGSRDYRWWETGTVPGSVMHDLLQAGKIDDPFFELNSKKAEWASCRTWVYRREFDVEEARLGERAVLCLEGIDQKSRIFLNGQEIAEQDGMFVPCSTEITGRLKPGRNLLAVVIEAAPDEQPQVGKTSLTAAQKCRMTYWWDFCPRMIHQGIWRPVHIDFTGKARIERMSVREEVAEDLQSARVWVKAQCGGGYERTALILFGDQSCRIPVDDDGTVEAEFRVPKPRLWYPNGMGEQWEYPVQVTVLCGGEISDERKTRHGLKRAEWLHNPGREQNEPFLLKINGKPLFIKGLNWVPADVMYGAADEKKTEALFSLLRDAHVNLLRVWGGGLIETEEFYRLCARHGILVWQEFIFSSSAIDNRPPEDPAFLARMRRETESIVRRRGSETALLCWCGGNELQSDDGMPLTCSHPLLAMMREVTGLEDGSHRFLPTSPSGGVFSNSPENIRSCPEKMCDVHGPWEHQGIGKQQRLYNEGACQLHSEFGVEGMTNAYALNRSIAPEHRLPAGKDNPYYFHRGAWWINDALLEKMFGPLTDSVERMRRCSQFSQYEGLKYAVERERSRFPQCGGSIPWQFNEPFPNAFCTCQVDYYGQPKPAYYGIRRAYAPQMPAARFESASLKGRQMLEAAVTILQEEERPASVCCSVFTPDGTCLTEQTMDFRGREEQMLRCPTAECAGFLLLRLSLTGTDAVNEYLFTCGDHFRGVTETGRPRLEGRTEGNVLRMKNTGGDAALFLTVFPEVPDPANHPLRFSDGAFCLLPGEEKTVLLQGHVNGALWAEGLNVPPQAIA